MPVELPWPDPRLRPNAARRQHYHLNAKIASSYRQQAYWLTEASGMRLPEREGNIMVRMTFHPPNRQRRDMDGNLSACKPAIDGLSDALGVDDARFEYTLLKGEPVPKGKVVVEVL